MKNNMYYWLEADEPVAQQAPAATPQPNQPVMGGGEEQPPQQPPKQDVPDYVEDDPQNPDQAPQNEDQDFEQWRNEFLKLSVKNDVNEMLASIHQIRDRKLDLSQRKFVEDNFQILIYRQEANVTKATKQIRNLIKQDLDRTNPGTTIMQHLTAVLEQDPILSQIPIKLAGLYGMKGDLHRKFIAALLGAIQVGGGGSREDLLYADMEYTINISTRYHTQFGEITLGKWSLKSDDPQRYLTEPELDRLQDGSPEEKQVLRRRIIIESISEKFKQRAFLINISSEDGTVHHLGWDLGDSLLAAYKEGKVVVRGKQNSEKDAMISDTGEIVNLIDLDILFVMETGEMDDEGMPEMVEVPFMQRRDSVLYLNGDLQTITRSSENLSGMFFHNSPYNGNPGEIQSIMRCIPNLTQILSQRCA